MEAVLISLGVCIFSVSKSNWLSGSFEKDMMGLVMLSTYVLSDSFTSQWQSRLYRDYGKIDHYQVSLFFLFRVFDCLAISHL